MTNLYMDLDSEKIYTFSELKKEIIFNYELNDNVSKEEILNDYIFNLLYQNGGNLKILD